MVWWHHWSVVVIKAFYKSSDEQIFTNVLPAVLEMAACIQTGDAYGWWIVWEFIPVTLQLKPCLIGFTYIRKYVFEFNREWYNVSHKDWQLLQVCHFSGLISNTIKPQWNMYIIWWCVLFDWQDHYRIHCIQIQVASNNVRNFHQNVSSEKPLIALSYTFCDLSRSRYQLIPHAVHYQQFLDGLSEVYLCHNSLAISKLWTIIYFSWKSSYKAW